MTKAKLIEKLAKDTKFTKAAAGRTLESFIDGVTKGLKKRNRKVANHSDLWCLREFLRKTVGSRQQIGSCAKSPIESPNQLSWSRQDRLCVEHGVRH